MKRRTALLSLVAGLAAARSISNAAENAAERTGGDSVAASPATSSLHIAMVIFPGLTQLDFTGPFEVFARIPGVDVAVVAEKMDPVVSDVGLRIVPTHTFETAPMPDVLFVPGGPGQNAQMTNDVLIDYLRTASNHAKTISSVCTGSLLLGAAGLLQGYRATCHWLSIDQLAYFGAVAQQDRVVIDRNRITGAGVTSGMDFAFSVVASLRGEALARRLELMLEYDPKPPFRAGTPQLAGPELVHEVRQLAAPMLEERRRQSVAAASRLRAAAYVAE